MSAPDNNDNNMSSRQRDYLSRTDSSLSNTPFLSQVAQNPAYASNNSYSMSQTPYNSYQQSYGAGPHYQYAHVPGLGAPNPHPHPSQPQLGYHQGHDSYGPSQIPRGMQTGYNYGTASYQNFVTAPSYNNNDPTRSGPFPGYGSYYNQATVLPPSVTQRSPYNAPPAPSNDAAFEYNPLLVSPRRRRASDVADFIRTGAADVHDTKSRAEERTRRNSQGSSRPPSRSRSRNSSLDLAMRQVQLGTATSVPASNKEADARGSAIPFLGVEEKPVPAWFHKIRDGYKPTIKEMFNALPLIEACRMAAPSSAGVIVIRNIPYSTPRSEIIAFVGRNAQIIGMPQGSPYHAVHIIMERHTGKTMDSYVEFTKAAEAMFVVNSLTRRSQQGRPAKIGDRVVQVELSSQNELMEALFPRTKNVVWEGGIPNILIHDEEYYQGVTTTGFSGFLQDEEINLMVKHAETPQRSPFAQRCNIRCYESLISTLYKYPWYAIDHVLMTERRQLFDATLSTLRALIGYLRRNANQPMEQTKPTQATLQELTVATLVCPGFSDKQKAVFSTSLQQAGFGHMTNSRGMALRYGGQFPLAHHWPFQALVRDPHVSMKLLDYFASVIRHATTANTESLSLADQHVLQTSGMQNLPFGRVAIDYGNAQTMSQAGRAELNYLEKMLRQGLAAMPAPAAISSSPGKISNSGGSNASPERFYVSGSSQKGSGSATNSTSSEAGSSNGGGMMLAAYRRGGQGSSSQQQKQNGR